MSKPIDRLKVLPFVVSRDGKQLPKPVGNQRPRCFWNVKPTGIYRDDCKTGQHYALEYLAYEESDVGGCGILNWIVEDMPAEMSGIEHAFLQMVCFAARAGANRARHVKAHWDKCEKMETST